MLLVSATFVGVFLLVCVAGYLLVARRDANARAIASHARPSAPTTHHTVEWIRIASGAPPRTFAERLSGSPPRLGQRLLRAAAILGIAGLVTLGVIAGSLQLAEWMVEPVANAAASLFLRIFLHPLGAPLLAAGTLAIGLQLSRRFRRPGRFRIGTVLVALALVTFWPMQYAAASVEARFWEYNAILHIAGFFVSICLFTGGLEAMRRAANTRENDSWEFLR